MDSAPIVMLDPIIVYAQVNLPDGNAIAVDPQRNSVVLETFNPQAPDITLATQELSYEQYAQLRADNPHIDYPEFIQPEPGERTTVNTGVAVKQAHTHPNRYAQPGPIGNTTGLIVPKTEVAKPGASSNPSGGVETEAESNWWGTVSSFWQSSGSAVVHGVLDVAGLIPVVGEAFDLANAAIYTAEGDYVNASLSAAAAVPFAGMAATAGKAVKNINHAVDAARATTTGTNAGAKAENQGAKTTAAGNSATQQASNAPPPGGTVKGNGGSKFSQKPEDFFENAEYSSAVRRKMTMDDLHNFPESVLANADKGQMRFITGRDGIVRQELKIPGSYRGQDGFFEFIKEEAGRIAHRFFRPNQ